MKKYETKLQHNGKLVSYFTDNALWRKAYEDGEMNWEIRNVRRAVDIVPKPDIVLDIGANIGHFALPYSDWATTVHCFEPNPTVFSLLKLNIEQNNIKNVVLHNVGVSDNPGKSLLRVFNRNEGRSFVTDKPTKHSVEIDLVRVDDIDFTGRSVDFVKMDTEGFELIALRGMSQLVQKHSPAFQIELIDENLERNGHTSVEVWDFFNDHGYSARVNSRAKLSREEMPSDKRSRVDVFFTKEKK